MSVATNGDYYGAGSGVDYYAGTGGFIPEIWSSKLQVKFYASTCLHEITNNDYEGEIKDSGDTVNIRTIPDVTIRDYEKGMNLTNEVPTSAPLTLLIDKGKYFSVVIDDVDKVQTDLSLMDMFTTEAAEKTKIQIEKDVFAGVFSGAATKNKGNSTAGAISGNLSFGASGSGVQVTASNAYTLLAMAGQALTEQNVPESGRWVVIPAWWARLLKTDILDDASVIGAGKSAIVTGLIGEIDGMKVYVNNNLYSVSDTGTHWHALVGTRHAITFASQFTKTETLRAQSTFGEIVRGLNVFGYKVVKPEALVDLYVKQ